MKNEFVTPKIAQDLKDMGFDEECGALYRHGRLFPILGFEKINSIKQSVVGAALWQQAIDFFRDEKGIIITLLPDNIDVDLLCWYYDIYSVKDYLDTTKELIPLAQYSEHNHDETYHLVRERAIEKAIEIIKQQNDE